MFNVSQDKNPDVPNADTNEASEPVPLQQVSKNTSGSKIQTNSTQKEESCKLIYIYITLILLYFT